MGAVLSATDAQVTGAHVATAAMMPGMTLLLSRSDLEQLLDVRACLEVLRRSFLAAPSAIVPQRIRTDLPGPGTATVLLPGLVPDIPAYGVKVNAKFPRSRRPYAGSVGLRRHQHRRAAGRAGLSHGDRLAHRFGRGPRPPTLGPSRAARSAVIGAGAQAQLVLRGLAARARGST